MERITQQVVDASYATTAKPHLAGANKTPAKTCHFPKIELSSMKTSSGYIAIALNMLLTGAAGSIAGETYVDALDFRQRYRDVHECDPFYWHPLHLPEECADMYERLIRGRLSADRPVRIVKHRTDSYIQYMDILDQPYPLQYPTISASYPTVIEVPVEPQAAFLSPYEKMLESIRIDVRNQPSFPSVQDLPNFGPVALYHQPVSRKSAKMITRLSKTYGGADRPVEYEIEKNDDLDKKKKKEDINKWRDINKLNKKKKKEAISKLREKKKKKEYINKWGVHNNDLNKNKKVEEINRLGDMLNKALGRGWKSSQKGDIYTLTRNFK